MCCATVQSTLVLWNYSTTKSHTLQYFQSDVYISDPIICRFVPIVWLKIPDLWCHFLGPLSDAGISANPGCDCNMYFLICTLSQKCSQLTTGSNVEKVAIHSWIQSTFSGTHTLKTDFLFENGDPIPGFPFSNKNRMLNENFNSIQNCSFELNWKSNAANSSWNFILNQMICRESVGGLATLLGECM